MLLHCYFCQQQVGIYFVRTCRPRAVRQSKRVFSCNPLHGLREPFLWNFASLFLPATISLADLHEMHICVWHYAISKWYASEPTQDKLIRIKWCLSTGHMCVLACMCVLWERGKCLCVCWRERERKRERERETERCVFLRESVRMHFMSYITQAVQVWAACSAWLTHLCNTFWLKRVCFSSCLQ